DFQYSKSSVDITGKRIMTATYAYYRDAARTKPYYYRCKLRTGESISKGAWPSGSPNNGGRFNVDPYYRFGSLAHRGSSGTDKPCSTVNQRTIDNVWASLTPAQQTAAPYHPDGPSPTLVTAPDVTTSDGPSWLLPVTPALAVNGANLVAQSRTLISNTGTS